MAAWIASSRIRGNIDTCASNHRRKASPKQTASRARMLAQQSTAAEAYAAAPASSMCVSSVTT